MRAWVLVVLVGCAPGEVEIGPKDSGTDSGGGEEPAVDRDGDGVSDAADCAPDSAAVSPAAREACDGVDNDCDGLVDETFDVDHDGWLADDPECAGMPAGGDCDDLDPTVSPGADEACNARDDDCDGVVDNAPDRDGDGVTLCDDCDDADPTVFPGAAETCNGVDDDCTGAADEAFDDDGDGLSECGGDCDDADPWRSAGIPERCDGQDNDCDGDVDEGFDADGDGYATCRGDCDDTRAEAHPGAPELCNGLEDDCDATTADDADLDGDGLSLCAGDCDDTSAAALPGGTEACDGVDNDCDGGTDNLPECFGCVDDGTYLYCTTSVAWDAAEAACVAFGRHLVAMDDATENAAVSNQIYAYTGYYAWIGLSDQASEGSWVWSSGSASRFTAWGGGQPDNSGNEDCVGTNFGGIGLWNDFPCTTWALPFVCE